MTSSKHLNEQLLACLPPVFDLAHGVPILVAVSGGADSMALAHLLCNYATDPKQLHWLHVHHGLRGEEADRDAEFVQSSATASGVTCHLKQVDTRARMKQDGSSVEMAARDLRYEAIEEVVAEIGSRVVVTAHTLDDQVETVLMKWARGAAPGALAGMLPASLRGAWHLMRPLLSCRREDLRGWLQAQNLKWCEDSSNADEAMLRNRLRKHLLPAMSEVFGGGWADQLARQSTIQAEEHEWIESVVDQWLVRFSDNDGVSVESLLQEPSAFQRRILHHWFLKKTGQGFQRARWDQLAHILSSSEGSTGVDIADGWRLERVYDSLQLIPKNEADDSELVLPVPGALTWGAHYTLEAAHSQGFVRHEHGTPGTPSEGYVNADCLKGARLTVRGWREGDRFLLSGMNGHRRKLQDVFTDAQVPQHKRAHIPLVCADDEIIWIPGYAVSEAWLVPGPEAASIRLELTSG